MLRKSLPIVLSVIMLVLGLVFLVGIIDLSPDFSGSGHNLIGQILAIGSIILLISGIIGLILSNYIALHYSD